MKTKEAIYGIDDVGNTIVDILNDKYDFYVEVVVDEIVEEQFKLIYDPYDNSKCYIIGWMNKFNIGEVYRIPVELDGYTLYNKKEFNKIIKIFEKKIIEDLKNKDYIVLKRR